MTCCGSDIIPAKGIEKDKKNKREVGLAPVLVLESNGASDHGLTVMVELLHLFYFQFSFYFPLSVLNFKSTLCSQVQQ
jgi:hypothetical protein